MVNLGAAFRSFADRPQRTAARRWLFQVHLYLGLILGLYAALVCVSGSALVFRPEMERHFAYGEDYVRRGNDVARPFQTAWVNLRRAYPTSAFPSMSKSTYPPPGADDPYRVKVQSGSHYTFVYVDRWTGEIVGVQHGTLHWLQELHFNLLGGPILLAANIVGALLLVLMCVTGAAIWWPGRRDWRRGFSIAWTARWQTVNYDLHSVTGIIVVVFLAAVAVTGVWVGYRDFSRYHPDEISWQSSVVSWPLDLDDVVDRAEAAAPGGSVMGLFFPQNAAGPFRVDKQFGNSSVSVLVGQQTGDILRVSDAADASAASWLELWMSAVHYGRFGDVVSRGAWVVLGVVPVLLFVTGVLMWWNRVLVKRLRAAKWASAFSEQRLGAPTLKLEKTNLSRDT